MTMWEGRKLCILIPTYRTICPKTHYTLFANYARYGAEKIAMEMHEGTLIAESRNILVHRALRNCPDAEWFLFVDDDMVLPVGNESYFNGNCNAGLPPESASFIGISRIMSHGSDKRIVGGLYYGRHEFGQAQCALGFGPNHEKWNDEFRSNRVHRGLIPCEWVATGFLKIHRSVFTDMKAEIDAGKWPELKPAQEGGWYGFFTQLSAGVGEDVSFGRRAKEIGIQSYVDASLEILHADGGHLWGSRNTHNRK
jgi:hypothetical protein